MQSPYSLSCLRGVCQLINDINELQYHKTNGYLSFKTFNFGQKVHRKVPLTPFTYAFFPTPFLHAKVPSRLYATPFVHAFCPRLLCHAF